MMAIQYAYYVPAPWEKNVDSNFYEIIFVGLKRGSDAIISQYNKEVSVECPNHVKTGWYYQPSTGSFISNEEFKKNPEKYVLQPALDQAAGFDITQRELEQYDSQNHEEDEQRKLWIDRKLTPPL